MNHRHKILAFGTFALFAAGAAAVSVSLPARQNAALRQAPSARDSRADAATTIQTDLDSNPDFKSGRIFLLPGKGNTLEFTVTDFGDLINPKIAVDDSYVAGAILNQQYALVSGFKTGETKLTLSADNAEPFVCDVTVCNVLPSNVIAASRGIIATTNGVYNFNNEKIGGNALDSLRQDDVWAISNYFIATKYGIYTAWNDPIAPELWPTLKKDDFVFANGFIIALRQGIYDIHNGSIAPQDLGYAQFSRRDMIASSSWILALTHGFAIENNSGQLAFAKTDADLTAADVYGISDSIAATSVGVFTTTQNYGERYGRIKELDNLAKDEYIGCNRCIITTRGVWCYNNIRYGASNPPPDLGDYLDNLTQDEVLFVGENYFLTKKGLFTNTQHETGSLILRDLNLDDRTQVIGGSIHSIVTTKGAYIVDNASEIKPNLPGQSGWDAQDVYYITDRLIVTRYGHYGNTLSSSNSVPQSLPDPSDVYQVDNYAMLTATGFYTFDGLKTDTMDLAGLKPYERLGAPRNDAIYLPMGHVAGPDESKMYMNANRISSNDFYVTTRGVYCTHAKAWIRDGFTNTRPAVHTDILPAPPKIIDDTTPVGVWIGVAAAAVASVALILGLGIGIPMRKNRRLQELTNQKVDTLATAIGNVFKKIISDTQTKKQPALLQDKKRPAKIAPQKPPVRPTYKAPPAPAGTRPVTPAPLRGYKPPTKPTDQ